MRRYARPLHALVAASAVVGIVLAFGNVLAGGSLEPPVERGLFDFAAESMGGRMLDMASYFTEWSNVLVAVVFALLAIRVDGRGRLVRVLLLDALLMIVVTGVVYNAILAPAGPSHHGIDLVATTLEHVVTPVLAVVVWLWVGPRGWLERGLIPAALVIPVVWIVYSMLRGAVVDSYPYGFMNVVHLGYPLALIDLAVILLIGIALCFALIGLDRLARRWA